MERLDRDEVEVDWEVEEEDREAVEDAKEFVEEVKRHSVELELALHSIEEYVSQVSEVGSDM